MFAKHKKTFGFTVDSNGNVTLNEPEAKAIRLIFSEYLNGKSLGGICEILERDGILSPVGKTKWSRSSVDNILGKGLYASIVTFEGFCDAQFERERRSNINADTGKRKATRYSSQNVLSGLLICAECGAAYRRITRHSGEVIWHCANRVEHGKKICRQSPAVIEQEVIDYLCDVLAVDKLDKYDFRTDMPSVVVSVQNGLQIKYPCVEHELSRL